MLASNPLSKFGKKCDSRNSKKLDENVTFVQFHEWRLKFSSRAVKSSTGTRFEWIVSSCLVISYICGAVRVHCFYVCSVSTPTPPLSLSPALEVVFELEFANCYVKHSSDVSANCIKFGWAVLDPVIRQFQHVTTSLSLYF